MSSDIYRSILVTDNSFFVDLNGVLGNYATLGLNIADFARYADKPSAVNVQAIIIPIIISESPSHLFKSIMLISDSHCGLAWNIHRRSRSDSIRQSPVESNHHY